MLYQDPPPPEDPVPPVSTAAAAAAVSSVDDGPVNGLPTAKSSVSSIATPRASNLYMANVEDKDLMSSRSAQEPDEVLYEIVEEDQSKAQEHVLVTKKKEEEGRRGSVKAMTAMWEGQMKTGGGGGGSKDLEKKEPLVTAAVTVSPEQEAKARNYVKTVKELMTSEESYVSALQTAVDVFYLPLNTVGLKMTPPWLDAEEISILFSNVQSLLELNSEFLHKVQSRVHGLEEQKRTPPLIPVADLVLSFLPFFKLYSLYVNNHERAVNFLSRTVPKREKQYEPFLQFLDRCYKDPRCKNLDLQSFLIQPVQRIPRYQLLVSEILKNIDKTDSDAEVVAERDALNRALATIRTVASAINTALQVQANNARIYDIQERFIRDVVFLSPGRRLVKQGPLIKMGRRTNVKREFFLFNDLLVYAAYFPGSKYKLGVQIEIDQAFQVADISDLDVRLQGNANAFQITGFQKSFIVWAATPVDKVRVGAGFGFFFPLTWAHLLPA